MCKTITRGSSGHGQALLPEDFHREVHILGNLRLQRHPNIIQLITAYTIKDTCNLLLFPKAEMDLDDLLTSEFLPSQLQKTIGMTTSLWGLVSALDLVHNFEFKELGLLQTGCHCEIKPKNILYHNGKPILSDFGLSRLRSVEESYFKMGEGDYLAPECEDPVNGFKPGKIGRASDIWSLGCVLLEYMVRMNSEQDGHNKLQEFRDNRKVVLGWRWTVQSFREDDRVNPAVLKVLDAQREAHSTSPRQKFLAGLAQIIVSMLQFDPLARPNAEEVLRKLFRISLQSILDEIYSILRTHKALGDERLLIEHRRLSKWRKASGLQEFSANRSDTHWFATKHMYEDYNSLQSHLIEYLSYTELIYTELDRNASPSDHLYGGLQGSIGKLYHKMDLSEGEQTTSHPTSLEYENISTSAQQRPQNSLVRAPEAPEALPVRSSNVNLDMTMLARYRIKVPMTSLYEKFTLHLTILKRLTPYRTNPIDRCAFRISIGRASNSRKPVPDFDIFESPVFEATWSIAQDHKLTGLYSKLLTFNIGPVNEHVQFCMFYMPFSLLC